MAHGKGHYYYGNVLSVESIFTLLAQSSAIMLEFSLVKGM